MNKINELISQKLVVNAEGKVTTKDDTTRVTQKISLVHKDKLDKLCDTLGMSLGDLQRQLLESGVDQAWSALQEALKPKK